VTIGNCVYICSAHDKALLVGIAIRRDRANS
jgi:hypothetical protein